MKIAIVGHSHIVCIVNAVLELGGDYEASTHILQLRKINPKSSIFEDAEKDVVERRMAEETEGTVLTVLCPNGNLHNIVTMLKPKNLRRDVISFLKRDDWRQRRINERLEQGMVNYRNWLAALAGYSKSPCAVLPSPPPIESESHIRKHPGAFAEKLKTHKLYPPAIRLAAWKRQTSIAREFAGQLNLKFIELPPEIFSKNGFLNNDFLGNDSTHANTGYGELILRYLHDLAADLFSAEIIPALGQGSSTLSDPILAEKSGGSHHPYSNLPDRAFWKQAVSDVPYNLFDPVKDVPFKISKSDRVATAGSCFAQHVSRRIRESGFNLLVTEAPPQELAGNGGKRDYYDFSARYGNVYTARQLLQLFERSYGDFLPEDDCWSFPTNRVCDPFRPRIKPDGYSTKEDMASDRQSHLASVRQMFEQLDVFVFTLGLTECWVSKLDGAVYPLAPGVVGGKFDPARYEFKNFAVDEVVSDLKEFVEKLRNVNKKAKLIITVSPVPLKATYQPEHVLVSTTFSKSVLRVAAEMISQSFKDVYYFPSYEIIIGHYNRGRYFDADLRSVTREGVDHVLSVFMRHLAAEPETPKPLMPATVPNDPFMDEMQALAEAECDEEVLGL